MKLSRKESGYKRARSPDIKKGDSLFIIPPTTILSRRTDCSVVCLLGEENRARMAERVEDRVLSKEERSREERVEGGV